MAYKSLNVWIVNPYGGLPSEGWRDYRSYMLAKALSQAGHKVTWWLSSFVHRSKKFRSVGELKDPLVPDGIRILSVKSIAYQKNISFKRIVYEFLYGVNLVNCADKEAVPDIIVMADPSLFFAGPIIKYRNRVGCKIVLDVIDLWPELFSVLLPRWLLPFEKWVFGPLYFRRKSIVNQCDGVVAVCGDYLNAVVSDEVASVPRLVAYWGIDVNSFKSESKNNQLIGDLKVFRFDLDLVVVYAGSLGDAYDMELLVRLVDLVKFNKLRIGFVVVGDGPHREVFERLQNDNPTYLRFLGPRPAADMADLYSVSDVGIIAYKTYSTVAMPIKFFDYIAGGLAVLCSLEREVADIIRDRDVGLSFRPMDADDALEKIIKMKSDVEMLLRFKQNALRMADDFDSPKEYFKYTKFIERVVNTGASD